MRKTVVVSLLALTLSIPAAPALAASAGKLGTHARPAAGAKHAVPTKPAPTKPAHTKPGRTQFVAAGRLVSVDPAGGTLTFTVHGGRDKALRGHAITVTVTSATVIRRNDNGAALTDLLPGDHLNVKGTKSATAYTATRVSAEGADPTPSSPAPTATATPEPTASATPAPTATATPEPTTSTPAASAV